ncbi:GYD domain-containing protein [Micromonospora sp. NPDC048868]|uniref:GYD domain-containing protein n=1 Tax=Micromonospora sp. NPDC048868 TaxID=3364258 RepID=UPI0037228EA9
MTKFLFMATYTVEGINGLMREGGTRRAEVIQALVENAGGRVESFHFGLGPHDAYVICDLPDQQTAVALATTIRAAGGLDTRVNPLLTPEDMDGALRMNMPYRPPGG